MPVVLGGIALVVAAIGLVLGIAALSSDDTAATGEISADSLVIGTDAIEDEAVTGPKIAAGAVGTGKLADESVDGDKLVAGAVGSDAIGEGAVGSGAIADGAVTAEKLAEDALGDGTIADGSIESAQLAEGAVERANVAQGAIAGRKVADDSLGGQQIDESTLDTVPAAEKAAVAEVALALAGGEDGGGAPLQVEFAQASSDGGPAAAKGPVVAACPEGTQVVGGGASIVGPEGTQVPVALTTNTASGNGWAGSAVAYAESPAGWRLDVVATCASN